MCSGFEIAALVGAGGGLAQSLFGKGGVFKGEELKQQPLIPPGFENVYKQAAGMAGKGMQQPTYIPQMNQAMMAGYGIPLQYYMGMSP